jgi:hypothetical protein
MDHCTQCGNFPADMVVLDALDMGRICRACWSEIIEMMACSVQRIKANPADIHEKRCAALEKARATRSERAKEKAKHKAEIIEMRKAENPAAYEATYLKRCNALKKAREARFGKSISI